MNPKGKNCSIAALILGIVSIVLCFPYILSALAMACGTGSASMMSANVAPLMDMWPEMSEEIYALAYASNTLSGLDGLYMNLLLAIPMSNGLYKLMWKLKGKEPPKSHKQKVEQVDIIEY